MTTVTKVRHINYISRNNWGYALWNAINAAVDKKIVPALSPQFKAGVGDLVLACSTRIDCLPIIIKRINVNTKKLYQEMRDRDKSKDEFAYSPKEKDLKYELLIDINSFLFETYAGLAVLEVLGKRVLRQLSKSPIKDPFIKTILEDAGKSVVWYEWLQKNRGHFTHAGMSWIAVSLDRDPVAYDLLILKKNIKNFSNPEDFFKLTDLVPIQQGFKETAVALQNYLSLNVGRQ